MDKFCTTCQTTLPISAFWKDKTQADGHNYRCSACCKQARGRRIKPDHLRKRKTIRQVSADGLTLSDKLEYIRSTKDGCSCSVCGCVPHHSALDYHHKDDTQKSFGLAGIRQFKTGEITLEMIKEEIKKCILLCANCHRAHHAGALEL